MPATYNVLVLPEGSEGNFAVVQRDTETPQQMEILGFFYRDSHAHAFLDMLAGREEVVAINPQEAAEAFGSIMEKILGNGGATIIQGQAQEVKEEAPEAPEVTEPAPAPEVKETAPEAQETPQAKTIDIPVIKPKAASGNGKAKPAKFKLSTQQDRVLNVLRKYADHDGIVQISQGEISRNTAEPEKNIAAITPGSVFYATTRLNNMGAIKTIESGFGQDAAIYKIIAKEAECEVREGR